ncbi:hypothetical protein HKX48_001387, partial [Thoreauomyces humboldtii]
MEKESGSSPRGSNRSLSKNTPHVTIALAENDETPGVAGDPASIAEGKVEDATTPATTRSSTNALSPSTLTEARSSTLKGPGAGFAAAAFKRRMTLVQANNHNNNGGGGGGGGRASHVTNSGGGGGGSPTAIDATVEEEADLPVLPTRFALVTRDDVDMAFEAMSRGGKKIKREDAKAFVGSFFSLVHGDNAGSTATTSTTGG